MAQRDLVKNAADPKQVRNARRKEEQRQERLEAAVRDVLATPSGRLLVWELLQRAGIYRSVFDPSGSKTYYNSGRQDFGHEVLALLLESDEQGYLLMETEARRLARSESIEAAAVRTAAATEKEQTDE